MSSQLVFVAAWEYEPQAVSLEDVPCDSFAEPDMLNCLTVVFKDTRSCQGSGFVHLNRQMFIWSRDAQPPSSLCHLFSLVNIIPRDRSRPLSSNFNTVHVIYPFSWQTKWVENGKENWLVYNLTGYVRHIQNQMVFMIQHPETFLNLNILPSIISAVRTPIKTKVSLI